LGHFKLSRASAAVFSKSRLRQQTIMGEKKFAKTVATYCGKGPNRLIARKSGGSN